MVVRHSRGEGDGIEKFLGMWGYVGSRRMDGEFDIIYAVMQSITFEKYNKHGAESQI